jgi:hypothetical protein
VAVALIEGAAGEKQYSDRAVRDPVVALRSRVFPVVDPAVQTAQVDMAVSLKDGRKLHKRIEHAVGSNEGLPINPRDAFYYQTTPDFFGVTPNPFGFGYRDLGLGTFLRSGFGSAPSPNSTWTSLAPTRRGPTSRRGSSTMATSRA